MATTTTQALLSPALSPSENIGAAIDDLIPKDYAFVVIVFVLYFFLNFYMAMKVGSARKKYKVEYPALYAIESENENASLFNCIQRGHQNSLEMMPIFFLLMGLGGIRHPIIAASIGLAYVLGRMMYFIGYSTGDPSNRHKLGGGVSFAAIFGLVGVGMSFGVHLLI
ncbi:Microsomal glutathione s-transferase [Thalictrum thalictroides]|uniref:Glutathione S-transferase 3, mitochondrial n=1 Tax=Thalictrum thalictroides TaxID=46969 RepID=A0A7J6UYA0_THATH|nr:Microsomal glutathione s-transferase [Thalictrum thalictroides]